MAAKVRTQRQSLRFQNMKMFQKGGKSRRGDVFINVTALVDMMTVLVIFLVMQFNASGEMLFVSKDIKMARAENGDEVTRVPIVALTSEGELYFEGNMVASGLLNTSNELQIAALEDKLQDNRKRYQALGKDRKNALESKSDPTTTVNLQVDKGIEYGVLKRVLYTCEHAGYGHIRLAVGDSRKGSVKAG